ncbi:hypothetical protein Nepgr_009579 [Nepenthes gracilis]|uniref:3-ketoacyl-CoA synthase n=1 Tax=Nepenthes gracilis TaxID=150966 RepID=A0AAD3XKH0_NEPGR|nr:hypothetical protein Nepgr_009579 [Nepenthes gracilis]
MILVSMELPMDDSLFSHIFFVTLALIVALIYVRGKWTHVYLVDFICYKAPETLRVPISCFFEHTGIMDGFDAETLRFQMRVIERSGIGNETYLPRGIHLIPADHSFNSSMEEVKLVLFSVVQTLLDKHKIDPKTIDILITNCSLNCSTPSLAAMIINKFGLRSNVRSFNLSSMGCSAGILGISLAKDLLKVHKNSIAVVVSTESICSGVYRGKIKSMLLPNCLFRMGGAAILLSNRKSDKQRAKYELQHTVCTHIGAKDDAYNCIIQQTDSEGHTGVALARTVVHVAGDALKINMASLGPLVLPYSEQIRFAMDMLCRRLWPPAKKKGPYMPNFKKAFDHFCVHPGGKAVVEAIKERLKLTDSDVEASKMTLYRFGNTSSSSTWYSLCYLEAKGKVEKGQKIWQLAFGSGFKCNSAVWRCTRKPSFDASNAWFDRIHLYPVEVPEIAVH